MSMGTHDFADEGFTRNEDRDTRIIDNLGFLSRYFALIAGVPAIWMIQYHFDSVSAWQATFISLVIVMMITLGPRGVDNVNISNNE